MSIETISVKEAQAQLEARSADVAAIRQKIAELKEQTSAASIAKAERALGDALLAGVAVDQIVVPPMTSTQLRHAVQVLENRLAEALDYENQARSAIRVAKIRRLRELLQNEQKKYDEIAQALTHLWLRVSVLTQHVDAATGMQNTACYSWYSAKIPRGVQLKSRNPYEQTSMHPDPQDLLLAAAGNKAKSEIAELLKTEGVML